MSGKVVDLNRRAYLVCGAGGGGIGTAIAVMLAEAGATVIAIDNTELGRDTVSQALSELGDRHLVVDCDLTDTAAVEAMLAEATATAGAIRGAVNVVGGMLPRHWTALTDPLAPEAFDDVMRFNLKPALIASTAVARAIAGHGLGGSIVNVASAAGLVSMAYGAGYGAAKAALINLTRSMAVEWGGTACGSTRWRLAPSVRRNWAARASIRPKARKCGRRPAMSSHSAGAANPPTWRERCSICCPTSRTM